MVMVNGCGFLLNNNFAEWIYQFRALSLLLSINQNFFVKVSHWFKSIVERRPIQTYYQILLYGILGVETHGQHEKDHAMKNSNQVHNILEARSDIQSITTNVMDFSTTFTTASSQHSRKILWLTQPFVRLRYFHSFITLSC